MGLKLYHVSDSPPCLAVRMGLKYLGIESELIDVDFLQAEQASELYKKKNPQGEVPLLDDNGFLLSESVSILQYLADKYKVDETFYPAEPQQRAVINHRLSFYLSTFYKAISEYALLPICYAYERTEAGLRKVNYAVGILEEYFERTDGPYLTGSNLTIADLSFIMGTVLLQVIDYDLNAYPKLNKWYERFQTYHPDLWTLANQGLEELTAFEQNPPDLSEITHPLHPTDRQKINVHPAPEALQQAEVAEPNVEVESVAETSEEPATEETKETVEVEEESEETVAEDTKEASSVEEVQEESPPAEAPAEQEEEEAKEEAKEDDADADANAADAKADEPATDEPVADEPAADEKPAEPTQPAE